MQAMAERFSWYTGETFEITGAKPVDEQDTMVTTRILRRVGQATDHGRLARAARVRTASC